MQGLLKNFCGRQRVKTLKLYGPPGTGKTTAMLENFERELTEVKPDRLAFLTFTRSARLEVLSRTELTEEQLPWVKTIHAICYKLLGVGQNQMVDTAALKQFGKKLGVEIKGTLHDPWSLESVNGTNAEPSIADRLLQLNHLGRHRKLHLRQTLRYAPTDLDFHYAKWFTEAYRHWKTAERLLDYTDLLTEYLLRGRALDLDVMFIDEAQDLSYLQWDVTRKLGATVQRRYLAGDDDQAIFTWAGASPDAFNTEPADEVMVLPQSYRIPRSVHRLSDAIVHRIKQRQPKDFSPRDEEGAVIQAGFLGHEHLGDATTFVLFRNHFRALELAKMLEHLGWPYGGAYSPLDRGDTKAMLMAYKKALAGHDVTPSEAQSLVVNANTHYLKPHAMDFVGSQTKAFHPNQVLSRSIQGVPLTQLFTGNKWIGMISRFVDSAGLEQALNPSVQLMSIHQSKGRQAHTVVLDLEMTRRTYEGFMQEPENEHRVFYVAVTRARNRLITLLPQGYPYYNL
jgi:DNA helicase-2/ATP-dependent DNA helicase PcrA